MLRRVLRQRVQYWGAAVDESTRPEGKQLPGIDCMQSGVLQMEAEMMQGPASGASVSVQAASEWAVLLRFLLTPSSQLKRRARRL